MTPARNKRRPSAALEVLAGLLLIVGGIDAHVHYGPINAICNEAEAFGAHDSSCTIASAASPLSIIAIIFGVLALIGAALEVALRGHEPSVATHQEPPPTGRHTDQLLAPQQPPATRPSCTNPGCEAHDLGTTLTHCDLCGTPTALPSTAPDLPKQSEPLARPQPTVTPHWTNSCNAPTCDAYQLPTNLTICDVCGLPTGEEKAS